jgi:AraC-like DNA-binding protein
MASAEAWVYHVHENEKPWGILVDERIRYKTLFEPGQDCHENLDEIIVPLDGRYWVKSGDWSRTLVPGEVAFIPRETVHDSGTATNLIGTHFLVLLFDANLNVLSKEDVGGFKLPLGTITWLKGAFRFLKQSPDAQGFLPLSILPEFFKGMALSEKLGPDATHPDPIVTQLMKLLEQPETPNLEELGYEVGLSPAHLQKRFRMALGFSPLQYANAWKLDAISEQIKKGNELPLVELATEYGFNDMKHFRELFQRRFGVSPSAYRKNPPPKS